MSTENTPIEFDKLDLRQRCLYRFWHEFIVDCDPEEEDEIFSFFCLMLFKSGYNPEPAIRAEFVSTTEPFRFWNGHFYPIVEQEIYVFLADIEDWDCEHPEALSRLPMGYSYTWAGSDGAWAEHYSCST